MSLEGNKKPPLFVLVQGASALFAFGAAVFWFSASIDGTADQVAAAMKSHGGMDVFGGDLTPIVDSLNQQGHLNAYAAACAGCAAVLQAIGMVLRPFS